MLDHTWRKSTRSGGNGQCVEARYSGSTAQVRDSKDAAGPMLTFGAEQWRTFIDGTKAGRFDR